MVSIRRLLSSCFDQALLCRTRACLRRQEVHLQTRHRQGTHGGEYANKEAGGRRQDTREFGGGQCVSKATGGKGKLDLTVAKLKGCNGHEVIGGAEEKGAMGHPTTEYHLCGVRVRRVVTSDGLPRKGILTNTDGEDDMCSEGGRKKDAKMKRGCSEIRNLQMHRTSKS